MPRVGLWEFFGKEHAERYYRHWTGHVFTIDPDRVSFHDFFAEQIEMAVARGKLKPEWADWPTVKARDYAKVTSELHRQIQARQRWEQETDYVAAEAEVDRILEEMCALESRIYSLPVRSLRDLRLKLDIVLNERWLLDDDNMRMTFASIGDFARAGAA
jgi:hypothetical protein